VSQVHREEIVAFRSPAEGWIPVAIEDLRRLVRELPLDLFIQLSESNYCHVFSRTTGLDYGRLSNYRQKGVTHLFARESDRVILDLHLREHQLDRMLADSSVRPEQKAGLVLNWTERTIADVFVSSSIPPDAMEDSRRLVLQYVDLMIRQPYSLAALLRLISHEQYLHFHSVAVAVFSAMLARSSGKYSTEDVALISWGGFLHDIGATRIEGDFYCDPLAVADGPARDQLDSHCRFGLEIIQEIRSIPKEVGYIVYQHHESPNGTGRPNGIQRSAMHAPGMLVAVVDAWSSLISSQGGRQALDPQQALDVLVKAAEQGRLDGDSVELLRSVVPRLLARAA
jgi:putative nucleotidyltransferase with HDIG domain